MKSVITYLTFVFLLLTCLLSCKKNSIETVNQTQPIDYTTLSDSCYFTINGEQFILTTPTSNGRGNYGANLDTSTRKYDLDSILYTTSYGITKSQTTNTLNSALLTLRFIRKLGKDQLTKIFYPANIWGPDSDTILYYPKGLLPYAVDYNRFNSQNGIALSVSYSTSLQSGLGSSYINQSPYSASSLNNDCQKDSKFEVINVLILKNGGHLLEARFDANLFDRNENLKRLENGYIRIRVD